MATKFHVGGRIIKTSLAVGLSIFIVQSLGIERVSLAAIVAVVTVQRTFYRSLVQSAARMGSVLVGALLGTVFGLLLGATPISFGLVTMAVILVCLQLNWQDNIVVTAVVAIGIVSSQAGNLLIYSLYQSLSALIGAVVALSINMLFAPAYQMDVQQKLEEIEESLRELINCVSQEMLHPDHHADDFPERIHELQEKIKVGLAVSKLFREEQRFNLHKETQADRYREAFRLFDSQSERLLEIHKLARRMVMEVPQAVPIARLLQTVGKAQKRQLRGENMHIQLIDRAITDLELNFEHMELPITRAEFITRSSLVHMFREVKQYYRKTKNLPAVLFENV